MYSPKIQARVIPALYRYALAQGKPMTQVVTEVVEDLLICRGFHPTEINALLPAPPRRRLERKR